LVWLQVCQINELYESRVADQAVLLKIMQPYSVR